MKQNFFFNNMAIPVWPVPRIDKGYASTFSTIYRYLNPKTKHWMRRLHDDRLVSTLSIPGTHDSATFPCGFKNVCQASQCQSMSIKDQLQSGIRFLDLRVKEKANQLRMFHGPIFFHRYQTIAGEIAQFLKNNPTQFVILAYQGNVEHPSRLLQQFKALKTKDILKVGQLRGKAWVISGHGIDFRDTMKLAGDRAFEDFPHRKYFIQNFYYIDENHTMQHKVRKAIQTAFKVEFDGPRLKFNFLSAFGKFRWPNMFYPLPYQLALDQQGPNALLLEELKQRKKKQPLGITIMDFPGSQLIEEIINWNQFAQK